MLVVEDHKSNRDLLVLKLTRLGFGVIQAENGAAAIDRAIQDKPDLIMMDLRMPVMDGYAATQRLKSLEETKNIPIVALSANTTKNEIDRAMKCGCFDYLTKPINNKKLQEFFEKQEMMSVT